MSEARHELDPARVVAVGGAYDFQARAIEAAVTPVQLLLDPEHRLRRAVDFGRLTFRQFVGRDSRRRWLTSLRGARQGAIRLRDAHLAPGVVILDPDQRVVWVRRGESVGDYPPVDHVTAALRSLMG